MIGESVKTNSNGDAFVEMPADVTPMRFSVIAPNGEVGLLNLYDTPEKAQAGSDPIAESKALRGTPNADQTGTAFPLRQAS